MRQADRPLNGLLTLHDVVRDSTEKMRALLKKVTLPASDLSGHTDNRSRRKRRFSLISG